MAHLTQRVSSVKREVVDDSKAAMEATARLLSKTLHWDQLEAWQKDNEYIVSGYRRIQYTGNGCFDSIYSYLHNETVNIHTHLWGSVLFAYLLATFYPTYVALYEVTTWKDTFVIALFLVSAIACLTASAFYHTVGCHSQEVSTYCHALDYSGIIILIVGSFFPSIYHGFFCDPHTQAFYLTAMALAGLGASYFVLNPEYSKPTHRGARTAVFIGLGLCAVVPLTHMLSIHSLTELVTKMGVNWLIASGALYIGGALLYANRIPERLAPGSFDYWFASHQIFHVCVVLAALAHYRGVLNSLHYRMQQPGCF
ncbi:hemolysin-III related-domain-containing protein [Crepidotus variabilis]|uniref:Hemolysin-III related-domain-containing protein n=1 Tax=Crepidotus variabilis TaxID=179855 RepID=A0A9P6EIE2_9AGAR|nr:hemolysin-III related-domain-containing protein [Crepidotus variabilis]